MKKALEDPRKCTSDEMIQTAVYIAGDEVCPLDLISPEESLLDVDKREESSLTPDFQSRWGRHDIARIHLSGIRRMIQLRNADTDASFSHRLELQLLG